LTMKRRGNLFNQVTDFNHLCRSARLAAHGTFNRDSLSFMFDLERNVVELKRQLEGRQYLPGEYRTFCITDPKPRTISASPFRDRVVHHSLCGTLEPVIERYLIDDCYACRVGKGTVAAIERARVFVRRFERFAKLDVRHYFETADHGVLKAVIRRLVKDPGVLWLTDLFIDKGAPGSFPGKGMPIGNLTSQNFANLYLGPFDHFVKETVRVPGYVRYMDDILLFDDDAIRLKQAVVLATTFLEGMLLNTKDEAFRTGRTSDGVPFLGFNIFPAVIRFDRIRRRRFRAIVPTSGHRPAPRRQFPCRRGRTLGRPPRLVASENRCRTSGRPCHICDISDPKAVTKFVSRRVTRWLTDQPAVVSNYLWLSVCYTRRVV